LRKRLWESICFYVLFVFDVIMLFWHQKSCSTTLLMWDPPYLFCFIKHRYACKA
jgi:hypothetical protein